MLPLLASGHGSEMMQARFGCDAAGTITLEMTADYGGSPMLKDKEDARTALPDILRIEADGKLFKLADLAPLAFEDRDQFDPSSPMPQGPEDAGVRHQLLTAVWRWPCTAESLRFTVPKGCVHDTLFWKPETGGQPKWSMLLAGDFTPAISVPHARFSASLAVAALLFVLLLVAFARRAFVGGKSARPPSIPQPSPLSS